MRPAVRYLGYAGFFFASVIGGLYWTFPWDAVKGRVLSLAEKGTGWKITAEALEPSWLTGFEARNVRILTRAGGEPILLERVNARAKLLPLLRGRKGGTAELPIADGHIATDLVVSDKTFDIDLDVDDVQLDKVALLSAAGVSLAGKATLNADLVIGREDPKATEGKVELDIAGFILKKGLKLGMFGLPRDVDLGDVKLEIPIKEGKADLKGTRFTGKDVELTLSGNIEMAKEVSRSALALVIGFKPTPALLSSDPIIGALLNNIQSARGADGFYTYEVAGTLMQPRFKPKR